MMPLLESWLPSALPIIVGVLLSSTLLAAIGLAVNWTLRHRAPAIRVLLLRATLLSIVLSSLLCLGLAGRMRPLWNWPAPTFNSASTNVEPTRFIPESAPTLKHEEVAPAKTSTKPVHVSDKSSIPTQTAAPDAAPPSVVWPIAAVIWLTGVLLLLAWMAVCFISLFITRRRATDIGSTPAAEEMRHLATALGVPIPQLLASEPVQGPLQCGLWRPAILLPANYAAQFDETALRAVLLHELIHLQRRDLWWNATARLLCALLWPQVLLWMVARRLEAASEEACDAAVLEHGCAPGDYARCLLDVAERFTSRRVERVAAAGVLPLRSALGQRVRAILDESRRHSSHLSGRVRALAALFVIVGAASSLVLGAADVRVHREDLSSPAATVRSFVAAINAEDAEAAAACVQGALSPNELSSATQMFERTDFRISIEDLKLEESSTTATVKLQISESFKTPFGPYQKHRRQSELKLIHQADKWKIAARAMDRSANRDSLQTFIMILAPPGLDQLRTWIAANSPATVTGRVLHEDGRPAANVKLSVQIPQEQLSKLPGAPKDAFAWAPWQVALPASLNRILRRSVTTNQDGVYTVPDLAATDYIIAPPPYTRITFIDEIRELPAEVAISEQRVRARRNETTQAPDITLTRGALVDVRVVDQAEGRPLPGITIIASAGQKRDFGSMVETDNRGTAVFRLPEGKISVGVGGVSAQGVRNIVAQSGGNFYSIDWNMRIFVDGKPMENKGTAVLQVKKGQTRAVTFRLKKYVAPKPKTKPKAKPKRIAMPRGAGVLLGRVVYENGRPAAGMPVRAIIQQKAEWALFRGLGLDNTRLGSGPEASTYDKLRPVLGASAMTDANGEYRLSGLTSAPYNLFIGLPTEKGAFYQPPQNWVASATEGAWAKDGQTIRRPRDMVLTRGALITGHLRDNTSGKPLDGVWIAYNNPAFPSSADGVMSARSASQGRFTMRVPPGTTSLYIAGPDNNDLPGNAVYADTGAVVQGYIIDTSDGPHDGMKRAESSLDGGARRPVFSSPLRLNLAMKANQTRRLEIWLQKVRSKSAP